MSDLEFTQPALRDTIQGINACPLFSSTKYNRWRKRFYHSAFIPDCSFSLKGVSMQLLEEQVLDRQACMLLYVRVAPAEQAWQPPSWMLDKTKALSTQRQGELCMPPPSTGKRCSSWLNLQSCQWLHTSTTQLSSTLSCSLLCLSLPAIVQTSNLRTNA